MDRLGVGGPETEGGRFVDCVMPLPFLPCLVPLFLCYVL